MLESNLTTQPIDSQEIVRRLDRLEQIASETMRALTALTTVVQNLDAPRKAVEDWKDPWAGRF